MSLADYTGPSNHPDMYGHLVGESIDAIFTVPSYNAYDNKQVQQLWIVLSSGWALVLGSGGSSSYWRETPEKVRQVVKERRSQIRSKLRELGHLGTVALLDLDEGTRG